MIPDMDDTSADISAPPEGATDARAAARAPQTDTRGRILDAARELVLQQHPAALTVVEIAAAARVSERTVYRYFPTKEELIHAVAERPTARIEGLVGMPTRWDEIRGVLRIHWQLFAQDLDMLRSERAIPGGLELRRARLQAARPQFDLLLADAGVPAGPVRDGLLEVLAHLTSSSTLLELVDRHELDVEQATDLVLDAVERLVSTARSDP